MRRAISVVVLVPAIIALFPTLAAAHAGHGGHGFVSGVVHPFTGLDHVLAMLAVGMWTAQMSRSGLWRVPAAFLAMLIAGGLLAMSRIPLPMVESALLATVFILGVAVLFALQLRTWTACALVVVFALFHGYAHLAEIPADASALFYSIGFLLASSTLMIAGIAAARLLAWQGQARLLRAGGGAIAIVGLLLALA